MYVDNSACACAILHHNIRKGRIPPAPVAQIDVRDLHITKLRGSVDVILAGFPCQDMSYVQHISRRHGVQGERSGLVTEVFRLANEGDVPMVFMENVPGILSNGIRTIAAELLRRGYNIVQTIVSAEETGALHMRRRWFCLAVKPAHVHLLNRENTLPMYRFDWVGPEPVPRLIPKMTSRQSYYSLLKAMANTVVPTSVQKAWDLCQKVHIGQLQSKPNKKHKSLLHTLVLRTCTKKTLLFDKPPTHHHLPPPLNLKIMSPTGSGQFVASTRWATPVFNKGVVRNTFNARTMRILDNMIMYEEGTLKRFKSRDLKASDMTTLYDLNPHFLEWLMGYPKGWLDLTLCDQHQAPVLSGHPHPSARTFQSPSSPC
jgi:DNA (cytosine-5)-methyltransferase 1